MSNFDLHKHFKKQYLNEREEEYNKFDVLNDILDVLMIFASLRRPEGANAPRSAEQVAHEGPILYLCAQKKGVLENPGINCQDRTRKLPEFH